ncbi:vesicular-fusion protein sec17 [Endocarpon pusillum Z07020]|uniref:Vesicular-fusion protein sec17 n=1 Tax=Endocarpon pusillum (strain Z07020 / HMAS-L-300199) TaxID=1263415 RepID=U1GTP5_ENDPU|nr:vesicular-fusion protein sec17 [Endocarpon pusillum Z07020]ERF75783.1 vesicular-fusion protein sec17 [Endocarpon pusillum Z07020]
MAQDPRALMQKADKAASSASGGFSMFGGRTEKWENAADLYTQAANAFRMQKQNHEAGAAFEKAADIQKNKLSEPDDMANTLTEAFKVYRKDSPEDAARVLTAAIAHYTSKGAFRRAATHQQNLGEVYELELGDTARALAAYETAAQWFESDNAEALANKLYLKVADLAALEGDYAKACQLFESVAKSSLNSNLMRWSVKDYFLKAGICHLASADLVATNRALQNYRDLDSSFVQTREHMLLQDLAEAVEKGEQELFADKLFQFDQLSKLDKWKTTLLLKVKNGIEEQGEDFS